QAQSRLPGRALRPLPPRELSTAGRKHLLLHASARNAASVWAKNASIFSRRACSRRITSSVEQLPRRTQITLGGGPCRTLSRWKSSSLLTITTKVGGWRQGHIADVGRAGVQISERLDEAGCEILVEEQLGGLLRQPGYSRSGARARQRTPGMRGCPRG